MGSTDATATTKRRMTGDDGPAASLNVAGKHIAANRNGAPIMSGPRHSASRFSTFPRLTRANERASKRVADLYPGINRIE